MSFFLLRHTRAKYDGFQEQFSSVRYGDCHFLVTGVCADPHDAPALFGLFSGIFALLSRILYADRCGEYHKNSLAL